MAILTDLPIEILQIIAADSGLTNRGRKQARLACRKLTGVMTPVVFRRAYLSRIKTDRDAFLSLANAPHLAAHVEEIIWFELEIDLGSFTKEDQVEVQLSDGRSVNLFLAAQDIFWLPVELEFRCNWDDNGEIVYLSPPECATEFLVQFKAAVARMPKLHTFASEQMAPHRIAEAWSDFLHIFLETIAEEKGRINKLHCGNELSGSLARIDPRYHAAMPYLITLQLSIANMFTTIGRGQSTFFRSADSRININFSQNINLLRDIMYRATELQELNVSFDCNSESVRWQVPCVRLRRLIVQPPVKLPIWKHLRSLKLGAINVRSQMLLQLIEAHVTTLRHLHLDQCYPVETFAVELSQLEGLRLESIIISDFEIDESDLVPEEKLLRFIRGQNVGDKELAKRIENGEFVTHNRRTDIIGKQEIEDSEAGPDENPDHSSEWWSDTDSDSEPDLVSAVGQDLAELSD